MSLARNRPSPPPGSRTRAICGRLAASALALGAAVVFAELAFRHVLVRDKIISTNARFLREVASAWPHEVHPQKPEGVLRIVGLADSFGLACGPDNYHYLLERFAQDRGARVEVANFSVGGYDLPDEYELLRRFGHRYSPDVVLHGLFVGNDLVVPRERSVVFRGVPLTRRGPWSLRPRDLLLTQWLQRRRTVARDQARREEEHGDGPQGGTFSEREFLRIEADRSVFSFPSGDPEVRWVDAARCLDDIVRVSRAMGARYVMVVHPDQYQVERSLREALSQAHGIDWAGADLDLPQSFLESWCRERGVPCLDLLPAFVERGAGGGLYASRDTHYNEIGNRLAAEEILAGLNAEGLLDVRGESPR